MTEKNGAIRQTSLRDEVVQSLRSNGLYATPVLSGAMGICVPVIAATTLRNGVILSLIFSLLLVPVCLLLWLIRGIFAAVDWCSLRLKNA